MGVRLVATVVIGIVSLAVVPRQDAERRQLDAITDVDAVRSMRPSVLHAGSRDVFQPIATDGLPQARPSATNDDAVTDAEAYAVYAALIPEEWPVRVAKATMLVVGDAV